MSRYVKSFPGEHVVHLPHVTSLATGGAYAVQGTTVSALTWRGLLPFLDIKGGRSKSEFKSEVHTVLRQFISYI